MSTKLIAALLFVGTSLVSLPALAKSDDSDDNRNTIFNRDPAAIVIALNDKGVNTTEVDAWGGLVRAFVTDANGHTTFQFFEPDHLEAVRVN